MMAPIDYVSSLSDRELAQKLKEHGVKVGPVVKTTRRLYEKKLLKLEMGHAEKPKFEEVPHDESEEDEEDDDFELQEEEEPAPVSRQTRNEPRRRVPAQSTPPRVRREIQPEVSERVTTRPTQTAGSSSLSAKKEKPSSFPLFKLILFIVVLVALGYLVFKNMEPEEESNIPSQIDAQV